MSLNRLQVEFTKTMAYFQVWCVENSYETIEAESFRTREQAQIYKDQGKGILESAHCKKLARDMLLYKDRTISYKIEDYRAMGESGRRCIHWLGGEATLRRGARSLWAATRIILVLSIEVFSNERWNFNQKLWKSHEPRSHNDISRSASWS